MNKTPTSALGNWEGFSEKIFYHSSEAWKVVSKGVVGLAFKVEETRHASSGSWSLAGHLRSVPKGSSSCPSLGPHGSCRFSQDAGGSITHATTWVSLLGRWGVCSFKKLIKVENFRLLWGGEESIYLLIYSQRTLNIQIFNICPSVYCWRADTRVTPALRSLREFVLNLCSRAHQQRRPSATKNKFVWFSQAV